MAENKKEPGNERECGAAKQGSSASVPGVTEVRTNDAGIGQPMSNLQPERAVAFQTSGLSGPMAAYPFPGGGGVVQCADKNGGGQQNREQKNSGEQQREEGGKTKEGKQQEEEGSDKKGRSQQDNGKSDKGNSDKGEEAHGQQADSKRKQKNNHEDEKRQERNGDKHGHHGRSHHRNKKQLQRQMPRWPTLAVVCILSLVCGVGGAWGYSALFGSSQSDDKGKGSSKGGKGSDKGSGSDSDQSSDIKELKKNLGNLDDGIKQLTARLDRLTESLLDSRLPIPEYFSGTSRIARMAPADDESPPIRPNAIPTQLNVLQRKVDQMSDLPARVHALEQLLPVLQEEIKMLEAHRALP